MIDTEHHPHEGISQKITKNLQKSTKTSILRPNSVLANVDRPDY